MLITLPIPPSANDYWAYGRGRVFPSKKAERYKDTVGKLSLVHRLKPLPLIVPASMTLKVHLDNQASDLSNRIKILEDALQKFAFVNDRQVVEIHAYRISCEQGLERVEVTVVPA